MNKVNTLSVVAPHLVSEWHPTKNGSLKPHDAKVGSSNKVWWSCSQNHEWQASVSNRVNGTGCPYCSNSKVLAGYNDLLSKHPLVAQEWNTEKNGDQTPETTLYGSNKSFWWKDSHGHEWQAPVARRVNGSGCPYCAGTKVLSGFNDLESNYPEIARQWHPTKNGDSKPSEFTTSSNKSFWWQCEYGHEWENPISARTKRNRGCSICANRTILIGYNDCGTTNPELIPQWHPTKNGELSITDVFAGSATKIWWKCSESHEWEATLLSRAKNGAGCPFCSGTKVISGKTDLATCYPEIAKEWNTEKNGNDIEPTNVSKASSKKVWWKCSNNHEWESIIANRTRLNRGCPYCVNQKITTGENDLLTTHPELALEWNTELNGELKPEMVTFGAKKSVWWQCSQGHSWKATPRDRIRGYDCPVCVNRQVLVGYNDLATTRPEVLPLWHPTKNTVEPTEISRGSNVPVWWICGKGHEWKTSPSNLRVDAISMGCEQCSIKGFVSAGEIEISDFLTSLGISYKKSERSLVKKMEFDIYIPEKKIAIEFNGVYWHSEVHKDKNYHLKKYMAAKNAGVQLIQIWEDDWRNRKSVIKSMLAYKLGVADSSKKIYARKTVIEEVSKEIAYNFLNEHHIQGFVAGSKYLALTSGANIVAVLVLKKEPKTDGKVLNIMRYASSCSVVGGFTKLLKHAEKQYAPEKFITFSDHCISDGGLYSGNGFIVDKILEPDYKYVVRKERKHKFGYRLKRFKEDDSLLWQDGLTERELAKLNGLHRIWDAGKTRWVKHVSNK